MNEVDQKPLDAALEHFRSQFHSSRQYIHLNNAGTAPSAKPAYDTARHWLDRLHYEGAFGVIAAYAAVEEARKSIAQLLGAKPQELAFFQSTAGAISQIAFSLSLQTGDEILVWDQEYPSNIYPWLVAAQKAGARLVTASSGPELETDTERLLAHVTTRTKAIAFSWVQYRSGAITELQEVTSFARARGIFTCADIIQGIGVLPFNFEDSGLDAACGGSHKWLAAPPSTGLLLLQSEHVDTLSPISIGAMTYVGGSEALFAADTPMLSGIKKYEPGSKGLAELLALGANAELYLETGVARISQEAEWLARKLVHGLRERGYRVHTPNGKHHRGAIVNFSSGPDAPIKELSEIESRFSSIGASYARRPPGIRLSPHAFNTAAEIERVLEALA